MSDQGLTYTAFIARELETERERRKALDARGASVVTVSAGLATLLTAVGAFVSGVTGFELPGSAVWPLTLALLAFAAAGLCGIAATFLWRYNAPASETLIAMLTDKWMTDEVDARNLVARLDVMAIRSLRDRNQWKARLLIGALAFQVAGLVALAYTVYRVLQAAS